MVYLGAVFRSVSPVVMAKPTLLPKSTWLRTTVNKTSDAASQWQQLSCVATDNKDTQTGEMSVLSRSWQVQLVDQQLQP